MRFVPYRKHQDERKDLNLGLRFGFKIGTLCVRPTFQAEIIYTSPIPYQMTPTSSSLFSRTRRREQGQADRRRDPTRRRHPSRSETNLTRKDSSRTHTKWKTPRANESDECFFDVNDRVSTAVCGSRRRCCSNSTVESRRKVPPLSLNSCHTFFTCTGIDLL